MATPVRFGNEFLINTTTRLDQDESAITRLADGRFVVAWTDDSAITGHIRIGRAGADLQCHGSPSGPELLVNTTTSSVQQLPAIADLDDGRFVVSWTDSSGGGSVIRAQVFNADGSKSGTEITVSEAAGGSEIDSAITGLAGGRFVVTWSDTNPDTGQGIFSQVFKANGNKVGTAETVHQSAGDHDNSSVTTLSDGRFRHLLDEAAHLAR